jgi:glycine/D-amino acid oxidase-like deaminating enzyme
MGAAVGFHKTGGVTLAFNEHEAALLHERMQMKREAGAPIRFLSLAELTAIEPGLSRKVLAASYCAADG